MSKSKNVFVTLFPRCSNSELLKDVGLIPYYLHNNFNYEACVACYQNENEYCYLRKEVEGLQLCYINKVFHNVFLDGCIYLIKNAKKISILNVYHLILKESLLWICLYKMINPKGFVYLKLDMDYKGMQWHEKEKGVKRKLKEIILHHVNLITAESKEICHRVEALYHVHVKYLPNGYFEDGFEPKSIDKKDVFLTVGRLGTEQKATDVLLEAFAKSAHQHKWKLKLIGGITADFQRYSDDFLSRYSDLKERVIFTGEILDKNELLHEYMNAKVFVLPSRWESFGIVLVEAMHCGCYTILSDAIPSANDVTCSGKLGTIFDSDNIEELASVLTNIANNSTLDDMYHEIMLYTKENYNWNTLCTRLVQEFPVR